MSTSSEETPIYAEEISRWRATHHGTMPGAVPNVDEVAKELDAGMNDGARNAVVHRTNQTEATRHKAKPRR